MERYLLELIYFPIILAISISKPISDFFWLREFEDLGFLQAAAKLLQKIRKNNYISLIAFIVVAMFFILLVKLTLAPPFYLIGMAYVFLTLIFLLLTILKVRSILVVSLIVITCSNFGMIALFLPITSVSDLPTLDGFLSDLISVFNYVALATFALGALWQFSRHQKEEVYSTISTMFYTMGYMLLNMAIAYAFLFVPTVNSIKSLSH